MDTKSEAVADLPDLSTYSMKEVRLLGFIRFDIQVFKGKTETVDAIRLSLIAVADSHSFYLFFERGFIFEISGFH